MTSTPSDSRFEVVMAEFTARWERGESPRVEDYWADFRPDQRVDLIFREFCLAGWAGLDPRPDDYLARFPAHAEALGRLFRVDVVLGSEGLRLWDVPPDAAPLPEVGNEIGPYRLIRDLGRGAFARVFLAEQSDLDDRLVVVKVSNRVTAEPSLLARAGHPHIVEVLYHTEADGGSLQIICMPFLGGAALSAVLACRGRRETRPGSGLDFLDDLDRASAEGYLPPRGGRPARDLIARLSYPGAAAWVAARLAEALDFAYGRGVIHGDVKPSNVLVTADGMPMLLDFNLSVGWRTRDGVRRPTGDSGGTLAYMAPERLRTVADPETASRPSAPARHRADIYSLGVLLLEMLTGRPPEPPGCGRLSTQELASFYVSAREHGGEVMIRSARTSVSAGLKAILTRCLAPDPADRYRLASELAEDLDLWLADRPLAHARDPGRALGLLRSARRRRRALAALTTGVAFAAVVVAFAWRRADDVARERAEQTYSQIVDGEDSGAFLTRYPGLGLIKARGNPVGIAKRHLDRYGVLEPGGRWRQRDEFRSLPRPDRDELEILLLEQTLRYAHALEVRSDSADCQRALVGLEQVTATSPFEALRTACRSLRHRLGQTAPASDRGAPSASVAAPLWKAEYLLGVAAELRGDGRDALSHYETALSKQPGSFWANYRAAAVAGDLKDYQGAAGHLGVCVDQHPENPALRRHFAACFFWDHRYQESLAQCDKAQALDPDQADTFMTRAFLRIKLKQFQNFVTDINRYDKLTGRTDRTSPESPAFDLTRPVGGTADDLDGIGSVRREGVAPEPGEAAVRNQLAHELLQAGRVDIALGQYYRVLEINPDDLLARFNSAAQRDSLRRGECDEDIARFVQDPRFEALVRDRPEAISATQRAVRVLTRQGKTHEALQTAKEGARLADRYETQQVRSYYELARAYAVSSKTDPALIRGSLDSLSRAYQFSLEAPDRIPSRDVRQWYLDEPVFDDMRGEYGMTPFAAR